DDVAGEERTLFGGGPGPERLLDRYDVVVDGLGQSDHGQLVAVAAEVSGEVGSRSVGIVSADGVEDVDPVPAQLLGRHVQRVLPRLDQTSLDAILDVGELDPAVADGGAAERVQAPGHRAHFGGHFHGIAGEQPRISVAVGNDPNL